MITPGEGNDRFVFAPFNSEEATLTISGTLRHADLREISLPNEFPPFGGKSTSKEEHTSAVRRAIDQIVETNLDKVVLSTVQLFIGKTLKPIWLQALREAHPDAFIYLFAHPLAGCWIGATPEPLLRSMDAQRFATVSLAGTRLIEEGPVPWGQKESLEQSIVTDYIKAQLINAGATDIRISRPESLRYGSIEHLCSHIRFSTKDPASVIRSLHPTPAVCGTPFAEARKLIAELELHNRSYYTGYVGLINENTKHELFVNLRCGEFTREGFAAYAGGGITIDSEPEAEWQETRRKLAALLSAIEKL